MGARAGEHPGSPRREAWGPRPPRLSARSSEARERGGSGNPRPNLSAAGLLRRLPSARTGCSLLVPSSPGLLVRCSRQPRMSHISQGPKGVAWPPAESPSPNSPAVQMGPGAPREGRPRLPDSQRGQGEAVRGETGFGGGGVTGGLASLTRASEWLSGSLCPDPRGIRFSSLVTGSSF